MEKVNEVSFMVNWQFMAYHLLLVVVGFLAIVEPSTGSVESWILWSAATLISLHYLPNFTKGDMEIDS